MSFIHLWLHLVLRSDDTQVNLKDKSELLTPPPLSSEGCSAETPPWHLLMNLYVSACKHEDSGSGFSVISAESTYQSCVLTSSLLTRLVDLNSGRLSPPVNWRTVCACVCLHSSAVNGAITQWGVYWSLTWPRRERGWTCVPLWLETQPYCYLSYQQEAELLIRAFIAGRVFA